MNRQCKFCEALIIKRHNVFCNHKCWGKWKSSICLTNVDCLNCNKKFLAYFNYPRKYCSLECCWEKRVPYNKGKSIFLTYEDKRVANRKSGRMSYRKHLQDRLFYYRQLAYKRKLVGGSFSKLEWENLKEQYKYCCANCKLQEPFYCQKTTKLTVDHKIPISKWSEFKKLNPDVRYECSDIENIQPLCFNCNIKKHNKVILD